MNCVFCEIVTGNVPAEIIYQDDLVVAFRDVAPQSPVHFLVIPRSHIVGPADFTREMSDVAGRMLVVAGELARQEGLEDGFRLVMNNGRQAGQSVFHAHLHVLGGRSMGWPPG